MFWILPSSSRFVRPCLLRPCHRPFSFTSNLRLPRHVAVPTPTSQSSPHVLSFRERLARAQLPESFAEKVPRPTIRNQILFFIFGSFVAFSLAAKVTNIETYHWTQKLAQMNSSIWGPRVPNNEELLRARYYALGKTLQDTANHLRTSMSDWPETVKNIVSRIYVQIAQPILDMGDGRRICWAIGTVNAVVYLMWKTRRLQPFMHTHFSHNPLSGKSYTILTSVFSHEGLAHLAFNSIALTSFGTALHHYLAAEQSKSSSGLRECTAQWHVVAFVASAGMFAALISHIATARITYPRLLSRLSANSSTAASKEMLKHPVARKVLGSTTSASGGETPHIPSSLGISGAVYAAVVVSALAYPDSEMKLIFPPGLPSFSTQTGVMALVAMDMIGILRGWKMLDHWAHLGGALFGALYYAYGPSIWDFFRVVNLGSLPPEIGRKKEKPS